MYSLLETADLNIAIGETRVCKNLNWEIRPNEVWGILGLNGVGKTTLLNTLSGLYNQEGGQIIVKDKPLSGYSSKQLARLIGYLFQQPSHDFPQTVMEYCSASLHPYVARWQNLSGSDVQQVQQALIKVGLENLQHRSLATLSGGERRRVEIASLLVQNPDIWLLDEPVNHLDIHHQVTMMELLIETAQKKSGSVVAVLHDANLAYHFCSHVLLLFENNEHLAGTADHLLTSDNLSRLYGHRVSLIHEQGKAAFLPW